MAASDYAQNDTKFVSKTNTPFISPPWYGRGFRFYLALKCRLSRSDMMNPRREDNHLDLIWNHIISGTIFQLVIILSIGDSAIESKEASSRRINTKSVISKREETARINPPILAVAISLQSNYVRPSKYWTMKLVEAQVARMLKFFAVSSYLGSVGLLLALLAKLLDIRQSRSVCRKRNECVFPATWTPAGSSMASPISQMTGVATPPDAVQLATRD
ncbi:hypothetical protein G5I_02472 [Acromyrmex echinatior]|uniref:Uncharacterized protein n=1 Tax=Acromyrmex echinatior TaxID=103372 RepID=F4WAD6_ACREC|nr:hypothetical protein G5I_02472 [Acromyrmex echinatior]